MRYYLLCIIALCQFSAQSQDMVRSFPSALPYDRKINGEFLFSKIQKELNNDDALTVKKGHFYTKSGKRVKLLGTTLWNAACFPDSALAVSLAERLHSLGFNAIRLAGIDNQWWGTYGSVFSDGNKTDALDPNQMKKLDRFITELRKRGLYIVLQIHSQWMPRQDDNVPAYDSIPWTSKFVNYFVPQFINHLRNFSLQLLNHKNSISNTQYKNDAAIAIIELTDDNSLFEGWENGALHPQGGLSHTHSSILDAVWNNYLKNKYKTSTALENAWRILPKNNKIMPANGDFEDNADPLAQWELGVNTNNNAIANVYPSNGIKKQGNFSSWVKVNKQGQYVYDVIYVNRSVSLTRFQMYEVRFWARTDAASPYKSHWYIALQRSIPPYDNLGLLYENNTPLTENWQEYVATFRANATDSVSAMLSFYLGGGTGNIYLDDIRVKALEEKGLYSGESLENGTVQRIQNMEETKLVSPARAAEQTILYSALVDNYITYFQKLIRDTIGCQSLITFGTTPAYINEMYAERNLDLSGAVQSTDYVRYVNDKPSHIANNGIIQDQYIGSLSYLTRNSRINKPHIISDYLMPNISSHIGEMMGILPLFAQYQDWDGVFIGTIGNDPARLSSNRLDSNDLWQHTFNSALWSLTPAVSHCIRTDAITSAPKQINLNNTQANFIYPADQLRYGYWLKQYPDPRMALFRKIRYDSILANEPSENPHLQIPALADGTLNTGNIISENEELTWNLDAGTLTANAPRFKAISGTLTGQIFSLGGVRIERNDGGKNGSILWISSDSVPLEKTTQSLLTLSTRNGNAQMKWKGDTSVWNGGWGSSPIVSEAMSVRLSFDSDADTVYAIPLTLDGNLSDKKIMATKLSGNKRSFTFDQNEYPTFWYVIKQTWLPTSAKEQQRSLPTISVSPHPVSNQSTITVSLPNNGKPTQIVVSSLNGEHSIIWSGIADGSVIWKDIDDKSFSSGYYRISMYSNNLLLDSVPLVIMR